MLFPRIVGKKTTKQIEKQVTFMSPIGLCNLKIILKLFLI